MKCPNCHKKIEDDSLFCPYCGNKIELEIECPKCGAKNSPNASFCKKCGASLKENKAESQEQKEKKEFKNLKWIFTIVSMSLMFLAVMLIVGLSFSPMLYSDFFASKDYTIINWASNVLKEGTAQLVEDYRYVDFANSIISLVLLGTIVILTIVVLAINISKFIKNLKAKTYYDFSKSVAGLFILFATMHFYFARFVVNQSPYFYDGIGGGVLCVFILVPIFFAFNAFVKEYLEDNRNLTSIIIRNASKLLIFIFALIIISNIGGARLLVAAQFNRQGGTIENVYGKFSNAEFARFILVNLDNIYIDADKYITPAVIFSAVVFVADLIVLMFATMLLGVSLKETKQKRPNYLFAAIISIGVLIFLILNCMFNSMVSANLNKVNDIQKYGCTFNSSSMNTNATISSMVLISLLFVNCIVCLFIDKKEVKENEEAK